MVGAPMNRSGKLHALLSTARVANIPSVVSNVWVGVVIAVISTKLDMDYCPIDVVRVWEACRLMLAGIFLYVSGNFFNDWMDRDWDAGNRPERALPAGMFNPVLYLAVALLLAVLGMAAAASVSLSAALVAAMIVVCVAVYTWVHKKTVWSVIPMGLCRALLPVMGAAGMAETISASSLSAAVRAAGMPAIALFCYIAGLSLVARAESLPGKARRPSKGLFMVPVALALFGFVQAVGNSWLMLVGIVPYALWIAFCDGVRLMKVFRFVSFLLAGIPLVDWIFLLPVGCLALHSNGLADPFGVACVLIPPLAVVAALLLQRLAPAT